MNTSSDVSTGSELATREPRRRTLVLSGTVLRAAHEG